MKKTLIVLCGTALLLVGLFCFGFVTATTAQTHQRPTIAKSEPLPLGATVEVQAIAVAKKQPSVKRDDGNRIMFSRPEGTVVTLLVHVPDYSIISLDHQASRLTKFIDDKGTDLLKNVSRANRGGEMIFPVAEPIPLGQGNPTAPHSEICEPTENMMVSVPSGRVFRTASEWDTDEPMGWTRTPIPMSQEDDPLPVPPEIDEAMQMMVTMMENMFTSMPTLQVQRITDEWMSIDCYAPDRPAPGTQALTIEGQFVFVCGQGTKTIERKNIPLDGRGRFTEDGMTITVEKPREGRGVWVSFGDTEDEMKMRIAVSVGRPRERVIDYTFLDAEGNVIASRKNGSVSGPQTHIAYFQLAKEVDSLTLRLKTYEKIETVTLPFSLNVGLGL